MRRGHAALGAKRKLELVERVAGLVAAPEKVDGKRAGGDQLAHVPSLLMAARFSRGVAGALPHPPAVKRLLVQSCAERARHAAVDEAALAPHIGGPAAASVMAQNADLFTAPYEITRGRMLAQRRDGATLTPEAA